MALYETVGSLIIILLALGVILLISVMIGKLRREKSGLESLQAANNRKVLIKLNSACTIIDRFTQHFNIAGHYVTGQVRRIIDVGDRSVPDREQVER